MLLLAERHPDADLAASPRNALAVRSLYLSRQYMLLSFRDYWYKGPGWAGG